MKKEQLNITYRQCELVFYMEAIQKCTGRLHGHGRVEVQIPSVLLPLFANDAVLSQRGYSLDHISHFLQRKIQELKMH